MVSLDYQKLLNGIKKYQSTETDICVHCLGVRPDQINKNVIIAPWWEPKSLALLGETEYLSESQFSAIKIWNIKSKYCDITYQAAIHAFKRASENAKKNGTPYGFIITTTPANLDTTPGASPHT